MLFKKTKCPNCETYHDPTLYECPTCHNKNELFSLNRLPKRVVFLHPIAQVAMFLAGFSMAGMLLIEIFYGLIFSNFTWSDELKNIAILATTYVTMLVCLLSIPLATRRKLFFSKFTNGFDYLFGLLYAIGIVLSGIIIGLIMLLVPDTGTNANQEAAESIIKNYPIIAVVVLCIIGPICEELTYRVGLYSFLRRINKYLAFSLTTVIFALIHFDFSAENMLNELCALPSYLACGFLLTMAYEHRGPACSILAHIAYNSMSVLITVFR